MNIAELTLERLKEMPSGEVFAKGEVINSPDGIYMTDNNIGRRMRWVAKRGMRHDWAIYIYWADATFEWVEHFGDKVTNPVHIRKLVPCKPAAYDMYRY